VDLWFFAYWPGFEALRLLDVQGTPGSLCTVSPLVEERIGYLKELRVLHVSNLNSATMHRSWSRLSALVFVSVVHSRWELIDSEVVKYWTNLQGFECDRCFYVSQVPTVLLELPRVSSVALLGAKVCDEPSAAALQTDKFICAGLRQHPCGVPQWLAHRVQRGLTVRDTSCATTCDHDLTVFQSYNYLPRDQGWSAEEMVAYFSRGVPPEYRLTPEDGAFACLRGADQELLGLGDVVAMVNEVSTCERCSWFSEESKDIISFEDSTSSLPAACQVVGLAANPWQVCNTSLSTSKACAGWCEIAEQMFAMADGDQSEALDAEELDTFFVEAGFRTAGGNWHSCLRQTSECVVEGDTPKDHAMLVISTMFNFPPSTCQECSERVETVFR